MCKIYFYIFFIHKNGKHVKDIKIFLKKKKHQYHNEHNKNLSEEEKEKKVDYVKKKYYLANENIF